MKFKLGDKVIAKEGRPANPFEPDATPSKEPFIGTVVQTNENEENPIYMVSSLASSTKEGNGVFIVFPEDKLELYTEE